MVKRFDLMIPGLQSSGKDYKEVLSPYNGEILAEVEQADVSGALAASVFHTGAIAIPDLKHYLADAGQEIRL